MKETPLDFDFLILNRIPTLYSAQRFQSEINRLKLRGLLISPEDLNRFLSQIKTNDQGDEKASERSFPKVLYRQGDYNFWSTQAFLAPTGWEVINHPDAFIKARDKWVTYSSWKELELPTPRSYSLFQMLPDFFIPYENSSNSFQKKPIELDKENLIRLSGKIYESAYSFFKGSFILKKRFSSQGRGVFLITSQDDLKTIFLDEFVNTFKLLSDVEASYFQSERQSKSLSFNKLDLLFFQRWIFQEFITDSAGSDVRNLILSERSFPVERENLNSFRSNLHQGGTAKSTTLSNLEDTLCRKIHQASGLCYSGVDFLRTPSGPLFLENNPSPGFEGVEKNYAENIALEILNLLN